MVRPIIRHYGKIAAVILCTSFVTQSCDSSFTGGSGDSAKKKFTTANGDPAILPLVAALECTPGTITAQVTDLDVDFDDQSKQVRLKGQFCPSAPSQLNLVFLLDVSYSLTSPTIANDPVVDGSCARLQAVEAIVKRYQKIVDKDTAQVKVSVIPFARNVDDVIEQKDAEDFEDLLTTDYFCAGIKGGTNYKAAFDTASSLFEDQSGKVVTYFITDGMPTYGGGGENDFRKDHRDAGSDAMDDLRNRLGKKMIFNTVYLGNDYEEVEEEHGFDFEKYLIDLTGDETRYRVAEKADDLVKQVLDIKPEPATVENDTAAIFAEYDGGKESDVGLLSFREHSNKDSTWVFETSPIPLFNEDNRLQKVIIEAANDDGEKFRVKINVTSNTGSAGSSDDDGDSEAETSSADE